MMRRLCITLLILLWALMPAQGVQPDEILDDAALEARARDISANLRCLVCQNESIDDSNADLAKTLRLIVRERLMAGDTDSQVFKYLVDRYGEFILLRPKFGGHTLLLWLSGPIILLIGSALAWSVIRRRNRLGSKPGLPLSEVDEERLAKILKDQGLGS